MNEDNIQWIRNRLIRGVQRFGRKYPYAGYGGMFRRWLRAKDPQPCGSYGNGSAMRRNEVVSLLQVRKSLETLCMEQVICHTSDEELADFGSYLDAIANAGNPEKTAEAVFAFHHELAVLSGNMLLPLLYHSFRTESLYLWTICGKHFGCRQLYETKLSLHQALLNRDAAAATSITAGSIQTALEQLSMFIS